MPLPDIRDLTRPELEKAVISLGEKPFHCPRIFKGLYREGASSLTDIADIPARLAAKLGENFGITPVKVEEKMVSRLDGTTKLLFRFADGAAAESVILFSSGRASACISSQSGCACGCAFCATGRLGFRRDLKPHEITAQFASCLRAAGGRLDSIVFMGMGEPFLNWENVRKSIIILSDSMGHHFSQGKMTVSTVGIIPVINSLADSGLNINLAISVITADGEQRAELAPMQKKYPVKEIIGAARDYCAATGRIVFLEYILFGGLNDSPRDAQKLLDMIKGLPCTVNLIIYNCSDIKNFRPSSIERAKEFHKIIMDSGVRVYLRWEKGADINAACGQLAAKREPCPPSLPG